MQAPPGAQQLAVRAQATPAEGPLHDVTTARRAPFLPTPSAPGLNGYLYAVSKFAVMRFASLIAASALLSAPLDAAPPLGQPEAIPTPSVPLEAAEAGKDVVHQLN